VGDDDQSIYAFRGANVGNMRQLMDDLHIAEPIKLTRNYRSVSVILDAANAVISRNEDRLGKDLWTDVGKGELIRHFQAADDNAEARFLVEEIQQRRREGDAYIDQAVLYRSNAQSRSIEHALFTAGIPYRVYGGQRFFERAEIKHALAYLRLAAFPEDDNAFLRVVNFPARGIGARGLEALDDEARAAGVSLWAAACKAGKKFAAFVTLIEGMKNEIVGLPLMEQVEHVVARSGLLEYYQNEKDGEDRVENLNELANAAAGFAAESDEPTLEAFLGHAALEAGEHAAAQGQDAVQLMSVHSAKGLEFQTVFITGLEEGLFPHENARNEPDGLEEERRLMYVAITRARRQLYLTHAQQRMLHGQIRYNLPSQFLQEIPDNLVRSFSVRTSKPAPAPVRASNTRAENYHPRPVPRREANLPYKVGARVVHPKYGEGVVAAYQGQGAESEIKVIFPKVGDKWFILEYARLTAVGA
jgi:DNA helicase-2/ATP-dependent DNA helicase PcrA